MKKRFLIIPDMTATWICIVLCSTLLASTEGVVKGYKETICVQCTSLNVKTTCQDLTSLGYIEIESGKYCPDAGFENELDSEKNRLSNFGSAFTTADHWRKFEQKIRHTLGKSRHWYLVKKEKKHETHYDFYVLVHLKPLIESVQKATEKWAIVVRSAYHWTKFKEVCRKLKLEYRKRNDAEKQHYGKYKKILKLLRSLLAFSALRRRQYESDILTSLHKDRTRWLQTNMLQQNSSAKGKPRSKNTAPRT